MPELPEVETIKRGLETLIIGKQIAKVDYDWPKGFPNAEADVHEFLIGAKICAVKRRAKVLLIELGSKYSLVIHLKMTGQLVFVGKNSVDSSSRIVDGKTSKKYELQNDADEIRFGAGHPNDSLIGPLPDRSTRVTFEFTDDSQLFFNDQRKFGWVRLMPTPEVPFIDFMKKVGPEPLSPEFTHEEFRDRIRKRANTSVKAAILDQTTLAGIGNIYADEGLWAAKIHPGTLVKNVSDEKLDTLLNELRAVLELSIEKGGSSDKNYVDVAGRRGSYLSFAKAFRREGQPCPRHPGVLIQKTRVAGRGTHTCPQCQVVVA